MRNLYVVAASLLATTTAALAEPCIMKFTRDVSTNRLTTVNGKLEIMPSYHKGEKFVADGSSDNSDTICHHGGDCVPLSALDTGTCRMFKNGVAGQKYDDLS
jgi:hypothetical protein